MPRLSTISLPTIARQMSAIAVMAGAALTAAPALAQTSNPILEGGSFSFRFSYDASDLQSPDTADAMIARLEQEVTLRCTDNGRAPRHLKTVKACVSTTMDQTIKQIGSSTLASTYKDRTNG